MEDSVQAIAKNITNAERDGCKSHGIFRLPGFCEGIRNGKVARTAVPAVENRGPGAINVDAKGGFSSLAFEKGFGLLVEKAKTCGIAAMSIQNCCHFHALWHDCEALAHKGLGSLSMLTTKSFVAHYGGTEKIYGTNPMAFGFPRQFGKPPIIFDQASSAMARGDITLCSLSNRELPKGTAIDRFGRETIDPIEALEGSQLTFGGHKGASIALMIELLSSMAGSPFSFEQREEDIDETSSTPTVAGCLIIAIDPTFFKPCDQTTTAFLERNEKLFEKILASGNDARLPSSGRHCGSSRNSVRERAEMDGVDISEDLHRVCEALAS